MISKRLAFLFLAILAFSLAEAQVRWAVFGGPLATSAKYTVGGIRQPADFKPGAMAGVGLKVDFDNQLYFFPAVYYSLKGYKVTLNNPSFPPTEYAKNNNTTIHTLEINPMFHIDLSRQPSHFFVRFGPAVDFAFSGTERFDTVSRAGVSATVERPMVFSFGDYGRISASGNLHLGYQSKSGFMIFGFYAHGIGSMNNADYGPRILHRIVGVSLGWLFPYKKLVFDTSVKE
ncbi:MAG TPA: outer membrane beta-barrel protein [Flavisolibacter sp.]|nr:outer membrane beta-barrel protein [Flavisolibacter sp.]